MSPNSKTPDWGCEGRETKLKIRVLYEENIKNGHKVYTTIDVPDGDYTVMLDVDYEKRLAEADPDKKDQVKRCNTVQEVFDIMNDNEYNNWRKHHRHQGNYKGQDYEDDGTEDGGEGGGSWSEPLMSEVADDRVFRKDEIERDQKDTDEANRQFIRSKLKPDIAEIFIATKYDGMKIRDYAKKIAKSEDEVERIENNLTQKLNRAAKKLAVAYPEKGF